MSTTLKTFFAGRLVLLCLCALIATLAPGARAQTQPSVTASALASSSVYRIDSTSYLRLSPAVTLQQRSRGTLEFTPRALPAADPNVLRSFSVSGVNLLFTIGTTDYYVSGSGTYDVLRSVGTLTVIGQRMNLNLRVGESTTIVRFSSGDVPLSGPIGLNSFSITLRSAASTITSASVLYLSAALVPSAELTQYELISSRSTFIQGCYAPCTCPLSSLPLAGRFVLVPLPGPAAATPEFALVQTQFQVVGTTATTAQTWLGAGILQRDTCPLGSPLPSQRLRASLRSTGPSVSATAGDVRFDSGCVASAVPLPRISAAIADNGFQCFNRVFNFTADPHD